MLFTSWLRSSKLSAPAARRRASTSPRQRTSFRPRPEALEDRWVLSGYQQTNLVGYAPGMGHFTDSNLNGWGMVGMPDGSFCVANPFSTGLATFYDRSGHVLPQTITVPASTAQPFGPAGQPTGVVYNTTSDFVIKANGKSAPATLIFDSIDGTISGWNPNVDPTHAIPLMDSFAVGSPALFTGLDMAQNSQGRNVLYAADILNNRVDMFDGNLNSLGSFTDPSVMSFSDGSFSAWSVDALNGELYVTFASLQDFDGGVVDVFNTDGQMLNRFYANAPGAGPLQNPWGITQAPANFGAYSNDLLIGNVAGAGNINAFDPVTGAYLGQLVQPNGTPIAITGLWDLEFGDGTPDSGKTNQLFFDAGPNAPGVSGYGLFGVIRPAGHQDGNSVHQDATTWRFEQPTITGQPWKPAVHQALAHWQGAGAPAAQSALLPQAAISIGALPASDLSEEAGSQVGISLGAAGWVWDLGASTSPGRVDLRWVLDHEWGHVLGGTTATTFRM